MEKGLFFYLEEHILHPREAKNIYIKTRRWVHDLPQDGGRKYVVLTQTGVVCGDSK